MNNLKIHDIKPLIEVPDYSLYLFMCLILLATVVFISVLYVVYKTFSNQQQKQQRVYIQVLKNTDLSQSKLAAYTISQLLNKLIKNEQQSLLAKEVHQNLEQYKYKKEVESFNDETLLLYKKLLKAL